MTVLTETDPTLPWPRLPDRKPFTLRPFPDYSAVFADPGARLFVLPAVHVTVHGGRTLFRRFEFSESRRPVPDGEYTLTNGLVWGIDVGVGR